MNKLMYIIALLLIVAIITITLIIALDLTSPTGFVVAEDNEKGNEIPTFRTYTKAVCSNASGFIVCNDELFANCGGFEYILPKNEVKGNGIFDKDWEDPRNE